MRKHMRLDYFLRPAAITVVAIFLMLAGVLYIGRPYLSGAWQRHEGKKVNAAQLQQATNGTKPITMGLGVPAALSLPRLGINLDVRGGVYNGGSHTWTIDRMHAFYMQASSDMPAPATPIIYGHDISAVFMGLSGVAQNEVLRITNTAGQILLFRYAGDKTFDPNDATVLQAYTPNTVILMTCSGVHFEHRRALDFTYVGTEQPLTFVHGKTIS